MGLTNVVIGGAMLLLMLQMARAHDVDRLRLVLRVDGRARALAPLAGEGHEPLERAARAAQAHEAVLEEAAGEELSKLALDEPGQAAAILARPAARTKSSRCSRTTP